ncbi:ROK family protein [Metabacillus niabensis]|uniref:ROK family protein n=1 Tax=Metabacillus niabensis TaxID=324854 RepID=UPI0039A37F7F
MQKVSSQQGLKYINEQKVLSTIYHQGPISRVEIAEKTSLTQQSVTNIVNRLMDSQLVREGKPLAGAKGRNPIPLTIPLEKLCAIGLEVAVKYVSGKLMDFRGLSLAETRIDVKRFEQSEETLECIKNVIKALMKHITNSFFLKGIGISAHALVDSENGIIIKSPGLSMNRYPLVERLKEEFDYPIYVENDVNLLALIENYKGRLVHSKNNIVLKIDYGIGGSITFNKQLFVGSTHVAGEFGHIKSFFGEELFSCSCGAKGCLTTLASELGLIQNKGLTLEEFVLALKRDDEEAITLLNQIIHAFGVALSNVVTFTNPDQILLTGRVVEKLGDRIVSPIYDFVKESVPESCRNVTISYMKEPLEEPSLAVDLVINKFFNVPLEILSL